MKRRILALLLLGAFGVTMFSCADDGKASESPSDVASENVSDESKAPSASSEAEGDSDKENSISVVVLGDSIARGCALKEVEKSRFSALLGDKLKNNYENVSIVNYGVDGMTGAELVARLSTNPPAELADCDYVLISIGGNNVLGSLPYVLGLDILDNEKNKTLFADYGMYLAAPDAETKKKYQYASEQIQLLIKTMNQKSSSSDFENLVVSAATDLRNEIPAIVSAVKSNNPNAKVIFQTIYNPYNNLKIAVPDSVETVDLEAIGERSVKGMNNVINELAESKGYTVADVYTSFEGLSLRPVNASWDLVAQAVEFDPHPNEFGHSVISDLYYEIMRGC